MTNIVRSGPDGKLARALLVRGMLLGAMLGLLLSRTEFVRQWHGILFWLLGLVTVIVIWYQTYRQDH